MNAPSVGPVIETLRRLVAFDTVSAHPNVALVANGGQDRRAQVPPSPEQPQLLFMGPFRYAPNAIGIRAFVEQAWPAIRAAHPQATLTILGGPESARQAREFW